MISRLPNLDVPAVVHAADRQAGDLDRQDVGEDQLEGRVGAGGDLEAALAEGDVDVDLRGIALGIVEAGDRQAAVDVRGDDRVLLEGQVEGVEREPEAVVAAERSRQQRRLLGRCGQRHRAREAAGADQDVPALDLGGGGAVVLFPERRQADGRVADIDAGEVGVALGLVGALVEILPGREEQAEIAHLERQPGVEDPRLRQAEAGLGIEGDPGRGIEGEVARLEHEPRQRRRLDHVAVRIERLQQLARELDRQRDAADRRAHLRRDHGEKARVGDVADEQLQDRAQILVVAGDVLVEHDLRHVMVGHDLVDGVLQVGERRHLRRIGCVVGIDEALQWIGVRGRVLQVADEGLDRGPHQRRVGDVEYGGQQVEDAREAEVEAGDVEIRNVFQDVEPVGGGHGEARAARRARVVRGIEHDREVGARHLEQRDGPVDEDVEVVEALVAVRRTGEAIVLVVEMVEHVGRERAADIERCRQIVQRQEVCQGWRELLVQRRRHDKRPLAWPTDHVGDDHRVILIGPLRKGGRVVLGPRR